MDIGKSANSSNGQQQATHSTLISKMNEHFAEIASNALSIKTTINTELTKRQNRRTLTLQ